MVWNRRYIMVSDALRIAHNEAEKSSCLKKKVGCAIVDVKKGVLIAVGKGGAKEPCEVCVRKTLEWQQDGCWSIHSELSALFSALELIPFSPNMGKDWIVVVTHGPCDQCLKYLHYVGVPLVLYDIAYHNDYSKWKGKIEVKSIKEYLNE